MLSKLKVMVVNDYPDGDQTVAAYDMPVIVDSTNMDAVSEIVAGYINAMALELSRVDRQVHSVQ